ncbi:MAG TPA: rhomboid family intramembrane serine protease [Terriglobales bacterium]|nr:rhomboid family intramembrane serine protease [Terriglobales bacterium]
MTTCIQCGREVPEQFAGRPCPACIYQARESARKQQLRGYLIQTFSSYTGILIAANVLVYLAMVLRGVSPTEPSVEQILHWGANFGPFTLDHQWWRLFTCMFLHIGIVHLLLNMWALFNVGPLAEALYGRANFLVMYLICGLAGSIASPLWNPVVTSAGASGAIFGVIGALIATLYFDRVRIPRHVSGPILTSLIASAIAVLIYGFYKPGIDNGAHLGGLIAGLILGTAVGRNIERNEAARRARKIIFAISAVVLVASAVVLWKLNHYVVPLNKAENALSQGKSADALRFADEAVREKPGSARVHLYRGTLLMRINQPLQAEQEFQRVLQLHPKQEGAWDSLGSAYARQDKWTDAALAFTKATELQPRNAESWYNLGVTMQKLNRSQDAVSAFKHAVQLRPSFPEFSFTLGLAAMNAKDYDEAIAAFQQTAKLAPNEPDPVVWLANAYSAKGMQTEADAAYARARQLTRAKPVQRK